MRIQSWAKLSAATALLVTLTVTNDLLSQRGRGGGGGGRAAGFQGGGAQRQMNPGPAMSRPAGMNRPMPNMAGPRPGGGGQPNFGSGNAPGGIQRPNPGAGPMAANRPAGGGFQRPNPGPVNVPKAGVDRGPINVATRPGNISRPGGGATSAQLNDFLGGRRPGAPGGGGPNFGQGNRPDFGKDGRPNIGTGDRPNFGKDGRPNIGKGDRPNFDKGDRPNIGDRRPDVNVKGDVNIGSGNTINFNQNRQAWIDNRHATGNSVRLNAGNRYASAYRSGAFRRGWGGGYPYYGRWGNRGPNFGWNTATYASLGTFLGVPVVQPVYYGYGTGGNVYYEDNSVYVDGQSVGTPEQYAQQALSLVNAAPAQADDSDWLPLGVFAYTREDIGDSQSFIELAINKQGVLAGTYYNETTEVSRPIKGTLDKKSQRVALGFADGNNADVVLETGIYNLTQDEAPALLHFGTNESTPALLVRLQPPADQGGP